MGINGTELLEGILNLEECEIGVVNGNYVTVSIYSGRMEPLVFPGNIYMVTYINNRPTYFY